MKAILYLFVSALLLTSCATNDDSTAPNPEPTPSATLYFPPTDGSEWETVSTAELGWQETDLDELYAFLDEKNSKSFIILKDGKIAVEYYFDDHNEDSIWYWASAGKTLTATVSGIAEDEGYININNKVSDYIGTGWTSCTLEQENLITCKNLLTMTSGLDDTTDATDPESLIYVADAGSRWAYANVYVKMQDVVATATNQEWSAYFNEKLRDRIGMNGIWYSVGDLSVYWSNTRSMARFGLMVLANGMWEDTQIISENYLNEATTTSQNINEAYGYLWWLNGKESYHLPQSQYEFSGNLIPNAPNDMYCGLGRDDQKVYVIPSKNMVIVRMGEAADATNFALSGFDNDLWEKINNVIE